jgi:hypothetical protein
MGATNQDLKNRKAFGHQPDPSAHDPRNDTLVCAAWAEGKKHLKYDNLCATAGTIFQPFALDDGWRLDESGLYYLFTKHLRDSGVPGEALKPKLKKDISFACAGERLPRLPPSSHQHSTDKRRATSPPSAPPRRSSIMPSTTIGTIGRWVWHGKKPLVPKDPTSLLLLASQDTPFPYYAETVMTGALDLSPS